MRRGDTREQGRPLPLSDPLRDHPSSQHTQTPALAGRVGFTLLSVYLLAVAFRIGGCYLPEGRVRDELPERGPLLGEEFPAFTLGDLTGTRVGRNPIAGAAAVLVFVPSLDWSPPSKARLLDLAQVFVNQRDVPVTVVLTEAQATPRTLRFIRDHRLPFRFVIDTGGLVERLGLTMQAPDGTVAASPATFVLDSAGVVRLRDVRQRARSWLAPEIIQQALASLGPAAR